MDMATRHFTLIRFQPVIGNDPAIGPIQMVEYTPIIDGA